jgi:hypothetical protein
MFGKPIYGEKIREYWSEGMITELGFAAAITTA